MDRKTRKLSGVSFHEDKILVGSGPNSLNFYCFLWAPSLKTTALGVRASSHKLVGGHKHSINNSFTFTITFPQQMPLPLFDREKRRRIPETTSHHHQIESISCIHYRYCTLPSVALLLFLMLF